MYLDACLIQLDIDLRSQKYFLYVECPQATAIVNVDNEIFQFLWATNDGNDVKRSCKDIDFITNWEFVSEGKMLYYRTAKLSRALKKPNYPSMDGVFHSSKG